MWTYEELALSVLPADVRLRPLATQPSLDLRWRETGDAYFLDGMCPGFRRKDLVIEARGRTLEVRAERTSGIFRPEHRSMRATATLPAGADADAIDASYADGRLSIRIAKLPHARRRSVPIRVDGRLPAPPPPPAAARGAAEVSVVQRLRGALRSVGDELRALVRRPSLT
jgi:HSP20 family molecular chaperone IbpA